MTDLQTFREETRDWLEANCPKEMRKPGDVAWGGRNAQFSHPDQKIWLERMGEKDGLVQLGQVNTAAAVSLKKKNKILQEEMGAIGARSPLGSFGIWMLGPALLEFANEEQKRAFTSYRKRRSMVVSRAIVNQDQAQILASLSTKAIEDGDNYVINGQKSGHHMQIKPIRFSV